ncbi:MAG: ATP-binding cassette domain-containing protein [Synergistaceae bacterium]|jgi:oligopeptide/dipeptide ABC transporter ATP-binding protein|nr:ATP-binding cassette domain-containing protein [Synergistaceae bacterium]
MRRDNLILSEEITSTDNLVEVRDLRKDFSVRGARLFGRLSHARLKAVDGLSFNIKKGEILSLVGESGCGKSTLGRLILNLISPTSGDVVFDGIKISALDDESMRRLRRRMQIIFQDPYSSLNPRMRVIDILSEPLVTHDVTHDRNELRIKAKALLERVGLREQSLNRFPHEFSGGQRQRIGIARAIALEPELIVCDEPLSALDVSIRSQVINLLRDLKDELSLTYLFISHDLSVVRYISDRICVMYMGKIVEIGGCDDVFSNPLHPYTRSLISAVPVPDPLLRGRERVLIRGEMPSPVNPPSGCRFRTRCPNAESVCESLEPTLDESLSHSAACHSL